MVIVLCNCNGGVEGIDKLPPHMHVRAGLVEMPNGEKRWCNGVITPEQRDFIQIPEAYLRFSVDDLAAFVARVRSGRDGSSA